MGETPPPDSVNGLIRRLRQLHGHLSAKDRRVIVDAIEGLTELTVRLYQAAHPGTPPPPIDVPPRREDADDGEQATEIRI